MKIVFENLANLTRIDLYVGLALNGIFTGLGVAIGSWIANKHILERLEKRMNGKKSKKD